MSQQESHGIITYLNSDRHTDYLYRISIKALIRDKHGQVLVVKETGRNWWDLPGGGMDHGEDIKSAIARELAEEVSLEGDFEYNIIDIEEPAYLTPHNFWQVRLIFEVIPEEINFTAGEDADELVFVDPNTFNESEFKTERLIYKYSSQANRGSDSK